MVLRHLHFRLWCGRRWRSWRWRSFRSLLEFYWRQRSSGLLKLLRRGGRRWRGCLRWHRRRRRSNFASRGCNWRAWAHGASLLTQIVETRGLRSGWLGRRGLSRQWRVEFFQPAANLIARVRRQSGKLERGNAPSVRDPNHNRLTINPNAVIKRKGKRNLFGRLERHHGANRKSALGEVAHHSAVRGRKLDVHKTHRAFA